MIRTQKYLLVAFLTFFVIRCATINPLNGGVKDSTAPRIDSLKSFPRNGQLNVETDVIELRFEEYIKLSNPKDNIIITPSMLNAPEISAKNKKLTIQLKEELVENTTYTITFNGAIQDITETNDSVFQYVFSTGSFIDSLTVSGVIRDGFTNREEEGFLVGLYPVNLETQVDSIPFLFKPIYIAQTDNSGEFKLNYLKAGSYYLFAFLDENKSLKLDPDEKRAFIGYDSISVTDKMDAIELRSFSPIVEGSKLASTVYTYPGRLELVWTKAPIDLVVRTSFELVQENTENQDSLVYWLSKLPEGKMEFELSYNGEKDTIKPLMKDLPESSNPIYLKVTNNLVKSELLPSDHLGLIVTEPILSWDPDKLHVYTLDTMEVEKPLGKTENLRTLKLDSIPLEEYLVKLDTGMIKSIYENENEEIWFRVKALKSSYYGTLILNTDTLFQKSILELVNDKGEVISTKVFEQVLRFEELIPGNYQVRVIMDEDGNGEWTGGDFKKNRQPEIVLYNTEQISIKSKWEKEVDWVIQNKSNGEN